jgi:hypothetical protein
MMLQAHFVAAAQRQDACYHGPRHKAGPEDEVGEDAAGGGAHGVDRREDAEDRGEGCFTTP